MKFLRLALWLALIAFAGVAITIFVYLQFQKPTLNGEISFKKLQEPVSVDFDQYGIPHIYAKNEADAFRALGYLHAQDRLFQMEMIRRVAAGRLSEILGEKTLSIDRFFRTLDLEILANQQVQKNFQNPDAPFQKAALAYLEGINEYIENGKTPLEYSLLGIPKNKFSPKDFYLIGAYMAFSFADAFREDPIVYKIQKKYGQKHLDDLVTGWTADNQKIPTKNFQFPDTVQTDTLQENVTAQISQILDNLPIPLLEGSNAWVISGKKTISGKPILENDTHIAFSQPSVWYEAHLECPELSFYGNFLAGFPFAQIGHNRALGWGVTMFENDDVDFYEEKIENGQVFYKGNWVKLEVRKDTIKVKGGENLVIEIKKTPHGILINDALEILDKNQTPIALWWTYMQTDTRHLQASYQMAHAKNIAQFKEAVATVTAPGLNYMYADTANNIAWWAAAKLVKRPAHVLSKTFLNGYNGQDEPLGWYDFSENPQSENPPTGFVYSANNQPDTTSAGALLAGYYLPEHRAKRIVQFLESPKKWSVEDVQKMTYDGVAPNYPDEAKLLLEKINPKTLQKSENSQKVAQLLKAWQGEHDFSQVAPTVFYKWWYWILEKTMKDELGEKDFETFLKSYLMKRTFSEIIKNQKSVWWDNISTKTVESQEQIISEAFEQTILDLENQFGKNTAEWTWDKAIFLEHPHPLGKVAVLDKIFNVGDFKMPAGMEVINNMNFLLNKDGIYKTTSGAAVRRVIDFSKPEFSWNILPTGQSGNLMSPHYADQAKLFADGEFRPQMMHASDIAKSSKNKLIFRP